MFYSRSLNDKINRTHERALRMTYNDKSSSFQDLRDRDNSVTIHQRSIRNLATETFRFPQGVSSPILNEDFVERDCNCNLRRNYCLNRQKNSGRYATESTSLFDNFRI